MASQILTSKAFVAHHARRLAELIIAQGTDILLEARLTTPTTSVSTILHIAKEECVTLTDLAACLGFTHQMAVQRIGKLEKLGLIIRVAEEADKRKKHITLTAKGKKEAERLELICEQMAEMFDDLNKEIGCDLTEAILKAEQSLVSIPMGKRI